MGKLNFSVERYTCNTYVGGNVNQKSGSFYKGNKELQLKWDSGELLQWPAKEALFLDRWVIHCAIIILYAIYIIAHVL